MNGHFNKRGRNQRRRQGVNPNRALDSNGPDVRIRGTAQQIYDKYLALARDATSGGDRVKAENYFQHAEHYFRVLRAVQGPQAQSFDQSQDSEMEGDQPSIGEPRGERDYRDQRQPARQVASEAVASEIVADDAPEEPAPNGAAEARPQEGRDREPAGGGDFEGRRRRRRPRRPREEGDQAEAGEDTTPEPVGAS